MDIIKLRKDLENGNIKTLFKLQGGMMNKSFVIEIDNKKYVWYTPTAQANEMVDRKLEKSNIDKVYPLGITSKNIAFYDDGMKVNEYIEGSSLNYVDKYDVNKVAILLHKLHDSGVKSDKNYHPFDAVNGYLQEAKANSISLDKEFVSLFEFVNTYKDFLTSQKITICHNDFQRSNIVKSIDDNYYVIDFEFMMNNDPIFDIAAFGNGVVEEGYELLKAYFANNPTKEEELRFFNWRILLSLQWYLVALIKDYRGEGKTHNIDFYQVAKHFLNNAMHAKELLDKSN